MLRDLDQRRKDSEHGVSSVSLTPASELLKESGRQYAWFLVAVVVCYSALPELPYFWLERSGSAATVRSYDNGLLGSHRSPESIPRSATARRDGIWTSPAPSALGQTVPERACLGHNRRCGQNRLPSMSRQPHPIADPSVLRRL